MRFPGARKLAAVAVPFALAAGALAFTVTPAQALQNCDTNTQLFAQAQAAEALGDRWTYVEEDAVDEGNYAEATLAYVEAGDAYRLADTLYAEACKNLRQIGPRGRTRPRSTGQDQSPADPATAPWRQRMSQFSNGFPAP